MYQLRARAFAGRAAITILIVAACSSPAPSAGGASPASIAASPSVVASSSASSGPASPSAATSKAAATVDLVFMGDHPLTVKGSKGCNLGTRPDGSKVFAFTASGADYPGLGEAFDIATERDGYIGVKW